MLIPNKFNGYVEGRRTCHKGGDGGAGQMRADEQARQQKIDAAVGTINSIFDDPNNPRSVLYDQHKNAVFDINKTDIDRQYADAERQTRFGLARAGLMGGSAQIDATADLQDRTNRGLTMATAAADQAAADLKTQDERSRQSLISLAQSGIDTGTAQTMALKQLDASAQSAAADRGAASIGNLFGDMSQAYLYNQMRQGQINGFQNGRTGSFGAGNVRTGDSGTVSPR